MTYIEYSYDAVHDVENIFELILKDKPKTAAEYITKLEEYINLLKMNRHMGAECKNRDVRFDCRILIFDGYKIFYQIQENMIYILRIINTKQNTKNIKL